VEGGIVRTRVLVLLLLSSVVMVTEVLLPLGALVDLPVGVSDELGGLLLGLSLGGVVRLSAFA